MKTQTSNTEDIKSFIRAQALGLGFDTVGFTTTTLPDHVEQGLSDFLLHNHHGDMEWMETRKALRRQPHAIWPEAKTVIVVGHNYGPDKNPLSQLEDKTRGAISVYAQNMDYHDIIKKKLRQLAGMLQQQLGGDFKLFVDTAPVLEKPLAAQAGLGWQGKHTCVVSREFGSWLFLGEIFTTLTLAEDSAEQNHCGRCNACVDICPTQAFSAPHTLDARKCISYLTIEHKGHIDNIYRKAMGNRIYGCDDCLAICPWNKFAQSSKEAAYHPRKELETPLLITLLGLDDAAFRSYFSKTAIKRIGRNRFIRNCLIAAGNSADTTFIPIAKNLLGDPSSLVRAMAVWCLSQLCDKSDFETLRDTSAPHETDSDVIKEWNHYG